MEQQLRIIALCIILVSCSALLPAQISTGKKRLEFHSQQKRDPASGKNKDQEDHVLIYIGELGSGELYTKISKADHSLRAALLDHRHQILWEIPVSSERITISGSKNFFVVLTDAVNPNQRHEDGRIKLKGFTCYDATGHILSTVTNTSFISQVFISQNSQIILLTQNGLESYSTSGARTWNFESRLASAEMDGDNTYVKTMQGDLSTNRFQVNLINAENGKLIHHWDYMYGNEIRLMHVNSERNWLLMTKENGNDWSLNLVDMKSWEVIATVNGLQSGIFAPVWNKKKQCYGFLYYKGSDQDSAMPALGILDCNDFSFESLNTGVQKLDLNNDQLKLLPEKDMYSFITVSSVLNFKYK